MPASPRGLDTRVRTGVRTDANAVDSGIALTITDVENAQRQRPFVVARNAEVLVERLEDVRISTRLVKAVSIGV